jgi:hypothetical protein
LKDENITATEQHNAKARKILKKLNYQMSQKKKEQ